MMLVICCLLIILTKNRPYFAIFSISDPFGRDFLKNGACFVTVWLISDYVQKACLDAPKCLLGRCHIGDFTLSFQWFYLVISVVLPCHFSGLISSTRPFDDFTCVFSCSDLKKMLKWDFSFLWIARSYWCVFVNISLHKISPLWQTKKANAWTAKHLPCIRKSKIPFWCLARPIPWCRL